MAMVENGATVVLFPELKESFRSDAQNWAPLESIGENNAFQFPNGIGLRHSRRHFKRSELPSPSLKFQAEDSYARTSPCLLLDGKPLTRRVLGSESFIPFPHSPDCLMVFLGRRICACALNRVSKKKVALPMQSMDLIVEVLNPEN